MLKWLGMVRARLVDRESCPFRTQIPRHELLQFLPYTIITVNTSGRSYAMADEEERIKAEKLAAAKKRVSLEN